MKALLVRLSSIGDVVHTLPVASALRQRGFGVDWVVEPAARPLLEGNPAVHRAIPAPAVRGSGSAQPMTTRSGFASATRSAQAGPRSLLWAQGSRVT